MDITENHFYSITDSMLKTAAVHLLKLNVITVIRIMKQKQKTM